MRDYGEKSHGVGHPEDAVATPAHSRPVRVWNRRLGKCSNCFSALVFPRAVDRARSAAWFALFARDEADAGAWRLWAEQLYLEAMGSNGQRAGRKAVGMDDRSAVLRFEKASQVQPGGSPPVF